INIQGLDKCWKDFLVGWQDEGISYEEMSTRCANMGHTISSRAISRLLSLPLEITKEPYTPRATTIPPVIYHEVKQYIIDLYDEDDEVQMSEILLGVERKFGLRVSEYPIDRIRKEAGLGALNTRYGHSVREANRLPRVNWCKLKQEERATFRHHVFTDERMVQLDPNSRIVWVHSTARHRRIKSAFKHPQKVMIWGGISWKGVTPLTIFNGTCRVDGPEYCKVLRDGYIDWEKETYHGKAKLVQDNARCHTARLTREYLEREEIEVAYIRHIHCQMERVIEEEGGPVKD
ncbi:hypothetical protein PFISCL1PPCAC_17855, partial [Pristionchus fissidentatus]